MFALMGDDRFRDEYLEEQKRDKNRKASEILNILHEKQLFKCLKSAIMSIKFRKFLILTSHLYLLNQISGIEQLREW